MLKALTFDLTNPEDRLYGIIIRSKKNILMTLMYFVLEMPSKNPEKLEVKICTRYFHVCTILYKTSSTNIIIILNEHDTSWKINNATGPFTLPYSSHNTSSSVQEAEDFVTVLSSKIWTKTRPKLD